jgi:hypothetical protein
MKIALHLLLASFLMTALAGEAVSATSSQAVQSSATAAAPGASADASLNDLMSRVQSTAQRSDSDIGRLQISKWKTDSASKKQLQASADSIQRNLTAAVPDLLDHVRSSPNSLSANFRLYRDLNALYDTFSALTEAAGAFGPAEQYSVLGSDLAQLDQARQKLADRVDMLAGNNEAELARLRARPTVAPAPAPAQRSRIVVDDNTSARKKRKSPPPKTTAP